MRGTEIATTHVPVWPINLAAAAIVAWVGALTYLTRPRAKSGPLSP
jgi:hypothetical protein